MPAPRAVLADITDMGLDPHRPHRTGASGHLKVSSSVVEVTSVPNHVDPSVLHGGHEKPSDDQVEEHSEGEKLGKKRINKKQAID